MLPCNWVPSIVFDTSLQLRGYRDPGVLVWPRCGRIHSIGITSFSFNVIEMNEVDMRYDIHSLKNISAFNQQKNKNTSAWT